MSRILIAGCGDVGIALAQRLLADGHRVWGLRRNPAPLPAGIAGIRADLTRPETLDGLPRPLDAVVYCATADARSAAAYQAAYVRGVENISRALQVQGHAALRFILVSSTSVYNRDDGGWVDEDSDVQPDSPRTLALRSGELRVLNTPWETVVVRFGGIYGPGRTALIDKVAAGNAGCARGHYSNRIHRDDCAGVLHHLLSLPAPRSLYLGVDCRPAPICEVMAWLAERLGAPAPRETGPGDSRESAGGRSNKRCSNKRLLASGYRFRYPSYREGYGAVLETRNAV